MIFMSIMKIKDAYGVWHPVTAIQGEPPDLSDLIAVAGGAAGLIKVAPSSEGRGLDIVEDYLTLVGASTDVVEAKSSSSQAVTPSNIDLAVKVGLTTNTLTLTDEEKASALKFIGAHRIVKGSYVGTDDTTENTITFDGKPLVVFITARQKEGVTQATETSGGWMLHGQMSAVTYHDANSRARYAILNWGENSLTIKRGTSTESISVLLNDSRHTYDWVAIVENA